MRVAIIGSGYVGLVTGACLADFGHTVVCIDRDASKIESLQRGEIPIYEPQLSELVSKNAIEGRLTFSTTVADPVSDAEAVFIAVGTPARSRDGQADLTFVLDAVRDVAAALRGYTVVVVKSTVPVGTGDNVERVIREVRPELDYAVVSNPEFLREGAAIADFKRPDRIVVGAEDDRARDVMAEIYRPLFLNKAPLLFMARRSAEMTKYAANAFLATKIAFINEVSDLCEQAGADVQEVAHGIGLDKRIGSKFLHAGPGFGGSCFPKDLQAMIKMAQDHGAPARIIETAAAVNDQRKRAMARRIIRACGGIVRGRTIAMLGLTFKPNTDDMRESPAISIITALQDAGARIRAYDPVGMDRAREVLDDVEYCRDAYDCVTGAEAVAIVTEWDAFRALDLDRIRTLMARPNLIDLRNIYGPDQADKAGFRYVGVGRGKASIVDHEPRVPLALVG
ncbi:UDP-glucose dehydrogenase family protein [Methylobacterium gnaphalii]|uniref:UDP-glucose 6-dehydrogenase n=1 Tax=Methylobacterium gnaphalii TaxID=1010610 RepID=A0A512JNU9_9HYPH|nr:UDP-glucose/GDP-mannose dehydrogenase family protein [Methylobacterium gnaphalii]GEP11612.1 UDP-glucose 6-dehydrogenase [Methylobacterium gnaphalii]GJD69585.1 UDP-glucose 6-dehydrogenase [Methylobacterium gnaphalii]GLS49125.1 UDP-glucose 6-dehydrogenase [Methylobacterium gnaphalii]